MSSLIARVPDVPNTHPSLRRCPSSRRKQCDTLNRVILTLFHGIDAVGSSLEHSLSHFGRRAGEAGMLG